MINKTLLISLISIICLYSGIARAKNGEDTPINKGLIIEKLKMLDRGIEKTREPVANSNNKEIIQMFNRCCNTREMLSDLIKEERFNKATFDQITETQKQARDIMKLIDQEAFTMKKLKKVEKDLSEKAHLISSSNNKKANELFATASKNRLLAEEAIKDNKINLAAQYLNTSINLIQQAVSFANGREKIENAIEQLQYMLKKAEKNAQISKKEEIISLVNEARTLVKKAVRIMISGYHDEDYAKLAELIDIATKLINRALRSSGVDFAESIRLDMAQLFAILNETNKTITRSNNPNAKILMDKAMKMAQEAQKAIISKEWKSAEEYIKYSYKLTKTASATEF
ncbi:hypothetical protein AUJ95_02765 [Candidatus Desantisbacteria bacterium CG2_30_40_21]|uniref:Methyl-accepting transducer domain-containing protein n=5 Tax=unclassified Candidatus Desantisiibacteriota TaxID=3106372 RepID=A0A2M7JC85_9BACT|nr:MAG: hypothetical protein AUJ95_02765 [Candidatus Desantisbacteria bacterium CG2_30_40_21]PIP40605.1 MAG: hypothetical protein COX18_06205 [Candidatus Desantisbacteria bacterium CG23_combo_of_CG06-09_8_20_14_all_40_23]PIX16996.1 MAG: hypothetical protein COZ71_05635 [Candidatus Desantisbacteria bacterium CG_4_8_14_3_um_filter_40_12]PIY20446.1 MAG: hypothetical protein COZ13_00745 [Candidatus Desantisbacteria bacterium CG_4_10_14_3_um_filter_40_18]PJB29765.1 MAG: hypothetical protein CO110_04